MTFKYIIMFLTLTYAIYMLVTKKWEVLECIVFLLPFLSISLFIGLKLSSYQFLMFVTFLSLLVIKKGSFLIKWPPILFLIYVTISTSIVSIFFMDFIPLTVGGFYRQEGRFILQIIMMIFFQFSIFFITINLLKEREKLIRVLVILLRANLYLAILGMFQFVIYAVTRTDIFPIGIAGMAEGRSAALDDLIIDNMGWLRICAIGGEPKHFATTLTISLFICVSASLAKLDLKINFRFYISAFIIAIILSLSTSGMIIAFVGLPILYLISFLKNITSPFNINLSSILILSILVFLGVYYFDLIYTIYDMRIASRDLGGDGADDFTRDFLIAQPEWALFGTGIGNSHNLSYHHITDSFAKKFYKGLVMIPATYIIKLIAENGIVGFLFFMLMPTHLVLKIWVSKMKDPLRDFFFYLIIVMTFGMLARYGFIFQYLFLLGTGYVALKLDKESDSTKISS